MSSSKPTLERPEVAPKPGRTPRRTPDRPTARHRPADRPWSDGTWADRAWSSEQQARFLAALAAGGDLDAAVLAAGRSRASAFAERVRDPAFALAWDEAVSSEQAMLEARLIERAIAGLAGPADAAAARDAERVAMWILSGRAPQSLSGRVDPSGSRVLGSGGRGAAAGPGRAADLTRADMARADTARADIARADALLAAVAERIAAEEEALLPR